MHDFMKIARSHHNAMKRAADDAKVTDTTTNSDSATAAKATATSTKAKATSTSTSAVQTTSSTPASAKLSVGVTINTTSTTSTSATSTKSTPSTTSTTSSASKVPTSTPTARAASATQADAVHSSTFVITGSAASATATGTPSSSGGLSSAATGGIIAGCVLAGLALLIFAVRKTFIRRRQRKRNTWGAGIYPEINITEKYGDNTPVLDPPPVPEKSTPRTPVWAPPRPTSPNPSTYYVTPPPMSYNNPVADGYSSPTLTPPQADMAGGWNPAARPPSAVGEPAMVRVVYIPSLPDELSVNTGEMVHIVKAFDDGWALCRNVRGEEGVVPLECLDRNLGVGAAQAARLSVGYGQQEANNDWKNMKRISSLSTQQPRY